MGKKKHCERELSAIALRQRTHAPAEWQPLVVCEQCQFHRWVTSNMVDENGEILPESVIDQRLSVYVECSACAFGKLDLKGAADADRQKGVPIIGSIKLSAAFFIGKWHIMHDPFPFDSQGTLVAQHLNHVQVICEKDINVYYELKPLQWFVQPGDEFP